MIYVTSTKNGGIHEEHRGNVGGLAAWVYIDFWAGSDPRLSERGTHEFHHEKGFVP
jgi:hypothetical protein